MSPIAALPNIFQTIFMVTKNFLVSKYFSLVAISLYCLSAHSNAPPSILHNFSGSLQCQDLEVLEKIFAVTEREKTFGPRPGWKLVEVCSKEISLCSLVHGKNVFKQFVKKHNSFKEDDSFHFSFQRNELWGPDWGQSLGCRWAGVGTPGCSHNFVGNNFPSSVQCPMSLNN